MSGQRLYRGISACIPCGSGELRTTWTGADQMAGTPMQSESRASLPPAGIVQGKHKRLLQLLADYLWQSAQHGQKVLTLVTETCLEHARMMDRKRQEKSLLMPS